jgi:hypothetical protein
MLQFRQMQDGTYAIFRGEMAVILGLTLEQAEEAAKKLGSSTVIRLDGRRGR